MKRILILNGPNLNLLGKYGLSHLKSLSEINEEIQAINQKHEIIIKQSNSEGQLIDLIHENDFDILAANLSSFEFTSIAIRDAITSISKPFYRIVLDNIFYHSNRIKNFNQLSYFNDISEKTFIGKNETPYLEFLSYI